MFRALLDDEPIGEHRFKVERTVDGVEVTTDASFAVRLLGVPVYRYRHHDREHWRGDCLVSLASATDDNGRKERVLEERVNGSDAAAGVVSVSSTTPPRAIEGCVMSYAYWNPALRRQTRLLNAQSGKLESVRIESLAATTIRVHGKPAPATGFRIVGGGHPIEVWYGADGAWIGLDAVVDGGRKLSYRLP